MDRLEVKPHHGSPTLFLNGNPVFSALHLTNRNLRGDRSHWVDDPYFVDFAKAGFQFYSISIEGPMSFDKTYNPSTGEFHDEPFENLLTLRKYAELRSNCKFLLRVGTEPRGADSPWIRQFPGECEVMESKAKPPYLTPSYASEQWIGDAQRFLKKLVESIYKYDLQDNIFGYLICGGDSAEWVKIGPMENWAGDYSAPMQRAFREWLIQKYGSVQVLRDAWNTPNISLEQNLIPSPEEQGDTDLFLFKDPRKRRKGIDHFEFLSHVVARDIDSLCGAAKKACGGSHLAGVFYGYLQEMVWNNGFFGQGTAEADVSHSAAARSGHAGLAEVLQSPHVDFLCSPYSYGFRGIGGEGGFMSPHESVRRAGKLWISEEDIRTHRWLKDSWYGQSKNVAETVQLLKRQFSNILAHASGAWFCDWAGDHDGSFNDPEVMQAFQRTIQLGTHELSLPDRSSAAEVAIVIDAESPFYRSTENNFDIPNWRGRAWGVSRMGAPVDYILLSDILDGKARPYKMYYMMNIFHVTAVQREILKTVLRKPGVTTLWQYASGFAGDDDLSADYCHDLTGIRLRMTPKQWGVNLFVSNFDHPVTHSLPTSTFWGTDMRLGPLFTVQDPNVTVLGTAVINQGRCEPGYVLLEKDGWKSAWSAAPTLPPGVLRELARYAGVHVYSDSEDVFYASHDYVMLHTVRSEVKHVFLPRKANVYEAYSGRLVARDCSEFTDAMQAGTTNLYYYGDAPLP